ncbi:MAG: ribonuclease R [Clostridiales bacterium]
MLERKNKILQFMSEHKYKPLVIEELISMLDVPLEDIDLFRSILDELIEEGKLFKTHKNRYCIPERMGLISGRVQGNERGYAFVVPNDKEIRDIFIPAEFLNGGMHNDKVIARINKSVIAGKRAEGEILRILKRANEALVGRFEKSNYFGFVVPDNKKISGDIFIPKDKFMGVKNDQKVIVKITKWPGKRRNPEGVITEILGYEDERGIEVKSVIKQYDIKDEFPQSVIDEVKAISPDISESDFEKRKDLRDLNMVTIDGADAKDLDDAVSLEVLPDETYRLGVHIADVSHYIKENSELDKEAFERGTSVYFVDRVIPMLPKELSNGICSLNPKINRLAFSVIMNIDKNGKVLKHDIFESIININERMTYDDVTEIIKNSDEKLLKRYDYLDNDFRNMEKLASILRKKRTRRGAIDFNFDEAKVLLDDNDKPIDVIKCNHDIANNIIEEFMLVCNETVAEHFHWMNVPFVYRIHENPEDEKIENLNKFLMKLGHKIKGNGMHPKAVQGLIEKVKGTNEERVISTIVLRSLQKARYSNVNKGHFGLSTDYYSHFTSPIRRYPDLIIHRLMKKYLSKGIKNSEIEKLNENLNKITYQCSEREKTAEEAERDIEDLKKVEFMKSKEGMVFDGIISNITSFGMFVELDNTIEGMIRLSSLTDDYYIYSEENFCLQGELTNKIYKIGDSLKVINAKSDIVNRRIDFVLDDKSIKKHKKNRK